MQTRPKTSKGSVEASRRPVRLPRVIREEAGAEVRRVEEPLALSPYLRCVLRTARPEFQVDLQQARQAAGF